MRDERALIHLMIRDDAGLIKIRDVGWRIACDPKRTYDFGVPRPGERFEQASNHYPSVNCDACKAAQPTEPAE